MDDRYIKIRKDILWKIIAIFITIILVGLLIFQIYSRTDKNKSSECLQSAITHFDVLIFLMFPLLPASH